MENLEALLKSEYIDLENPENSIVMEEVRSQNMPLNPKEALSESEMQEIFDWIVRSGDN